MSWRDRISAPAWMLPAAIAAALCALVAWSIQQRWLLLSATPFPTGIDGYFYPIELRSLLAHGTLQYPASPLTFWFMAPFAAATDPITGAKLGAAIGGALIAFPAYGVGARLGGHRAAGLVAATFATTSTGSAYLTIEFVKNGIGLTVALGALWLVLRAVERPSRARIIAAVAGFVAAYLAHKMAAGVVLFLGVPAALVEARHHLRGRRLLYLVGAVAAAVIALVVLGLAAPRRFLSSDDIELLGKLLSTTPHWGAPALIVPAIDSGADDRILVSLDHEALYGLLLAALAAFALVAARYRPDPTPRAPGLRTVTWLVLALAIAIGLPWLAVDDPQGLGFRLRIAAFVPAALAAAIAFGAAARWVSVRDQWIALAAIVIIIVRTTPRRTELDGEVLAHPALVSSVIALEGHVPAGDTLIVPHRQLAFMVAWYTGATVTIHPSDDLPREHRWRLLPLSFTIEGSSLDRALTDALREPSIVPPLGFHSGNPNGLVLVSEPTWEWCLARLPPKPRAYFAGWPTR